MWQLYVEDGKLLTLIGMGGAAANVVIGTLASRQLEDEMTLGGSGRVALALSVPLLLGGVPAHATDCAAEFAKDNRVKPDAGAFRMEDSTQVYLKVDGQWKYARTDRVVTEVVPPASLHLTSTAPLNTAEMVLIDGRRGWQKQKKDSEWEPMPGAVVEALKKESFSVYFETEGMKALRCSEQQSPTGTPQRVYKYQMPALLGITEANNTLVFDRQKRVPVSAAVQRKGPSVDMQNTSVITFDSAIRVTAPAGAQKYTK